MSNGLTSAGRSFQYLQYTQGANYSITSLRRSAVQEPGRWF